jgi:hypothetical protein
MSKKARNERTRQETKKKLESIRRGMARQEKGGIVNYHDPPVLEAELLERGLVVDRHDPPRKHQEVEEGDSPMGPRENRRAEQAVGVR